MRFHPLTDMRGLNGNTMISDITTRSLDANNAYGLTQQAAQSTTGDTDTDGGSQSSDPVSGFTAALDNAVRGAISTGKTAEAQTAAGLSGKGNLTDITTSVEEAKLTLQTVTTVRDRVVQAYQDVMKMSI
ncbi:hypothetical protein JCM25156A_31660 [Komagataeibacter kakiaceti JCM 25156]